MDVAVLVPRRAGDEWRERVWQHVLERWRQASWPLIEGHHDDGPFNRSAALNRAAAVASAEVLIVSDADTLVDVAQAERAAAAARQSGRLVIAYTDYVSLTRRSTRELILDGRWRPEVRWSKRDGVSGCLAVPRALWDEVGGFDERFCGWGFEDKAFFIACDALAGHERVDGEIHHCWHPRSPERNPALPEYQAARALIGRYKAARHRSAVRALLDERALVA